VNLGTGPLELAVPERAEGKDHCVQSAEHLSGRHSQEAEQRKRCARPFTPRPESNQPDAAPSFGPAYPVEPDPNLFLLSDNYDRAPLLLGDNFVQVLHPNRRTVRRSDSEDAKMSDRLAISQRTEGAIPIVSVVGEIDIAVAPQLRDHLEELLDRGSTSLVVDLTGVSFLDSTALGVLISILKRCHASEGELCLVATDPQVLRVFEITGLTDVFPIVSSAARAVEVVGS
jgi:anti-sigma B factor antagonist